ncbi:SLOG family protein [Gracilibacillus dipsosauri]|uniref:SLOG family protein n=1 Tax=Gracilibacillus dipsosauri TaxID=178340 RepID=UPI00240A79F4
MHKIITVTGNKPSELTIMNEKDPRIGFIKKAIKQRLLKYIDNGLEWVIISGQMGVELWAAEVVIDLQSEYDIRLGVFPPFREIESRWPDFYKEKFNEVLMHADFTQSLYEDTYKGPYQFSNKDNWLLEKTEASVILGDEEFPGSIQYFLDKAKKKQETDGYLIDWITPFDLEEIVLEEQTHNSFE